MAEAHLTEDEYNWAVYTKEYSNQVRQMEGDKHPGSDFLVKNWKEQDGTIVYQDNLHPNWKAIYSEINRLKPKSVYECGCGGMYHLKNIKTLFPDVEVHGCDLLQTQINFGKDKFEVGDDILQNVTVGDFSAADTSSLGKYNFVYSHAVMMHLSRQKALLFLKNMLTISDRWVYFIEGDQHDYQELLNAIGETGNWTISRPKAYNSWLLTKL
jgi:hypothetical protein